MSAPRELTAVHADGAPRAIGPYSQAIVANGFVFTAGQIGIDPATGDMVTGGVEEQTRRGLENVKAVLAAAGCTLGHVVKATIYLADMADYKSVNLVWGEYFQQTPPARSAVQVAALPRGALIEFDVIACQPG